MSRLDYPLRPFLPGDTIALRELLAASIEELTADDYDEDQRAAWASQAADAEAFAKKLGGMITLVIEIGGEHLGFGSLKGNSEIAMLFVHPYYEGEGVGTALADALERIAAARGAEKITVASSETAVPFFEARGYVALERIAVEHDDLWLTTTMMSKPLKPASGERRPT